MTAPEPGVDHGSLDYSTLTAPVRPLSAVFLDEIVGLDQDVLLHDRRTRRSERSRSALPKISGDGTTIVMISRGTTLEDPDPTATRPPYPVWMDDVLYIRDQRSPSGR